MILIVIQHANCPNNAKSWKELINYKQLKPINWVETNKESYY
jgi:hypothetical protein